MDETFDQEEDTHRFSAGAGVYRDDHTGLLVRIWDAWRDMPASTRRLIEERPSEARLLFYVLMSDLVFFLSWSIRTVVNPDSLFARSMPKDVALLLVGALLLRTTSVYVFSVVFAAFMRLIGGKGSFKDTRCGIFWGAFVAAPMGFAASLLAVAMTTLSPYLPFLRNETVELAPLWLGLLPYVWFVSAGAAEAHGFKKVFPVFAGLSLLCIVGIVWAMYLRANGVI